MEGIKIDFGPQDTKQQPQLNFVSASLNMDDNDDEDDAFSVISLPERLSRLYNHYVYPTSNHVPVLGDQSSDSVATAPALLERPTLSKWSVWIGPATNLDYAASVSSSSSCDNRPPPLPLTPPGSEYTSFVKASPSPPHHRSPNRYLSKTRQADVEHYVLRRPPTILSTLWVRTSARPTKTSSPSVERGRNTIHDIDGIRETPASIHKMVAIVSNNHNNGHSHSHPNPHQVDENRNIENNNESITKWSQPKETSLQPPPPNLFDTPTGIMLVFDRCLDCIDVPEVATNSSSRLRNANGSDEEEEDDDDDEHHSDQSASSIDSLLLVDSGDSSLFRPHQARVVSDPCPKLLNNDHLQQSAEKVLPVQNREEEEVLCLFTCWDDSDVNIVESQDKAFHHNQHPGRSKTSKRIRSNFHDLPLDEETKNSNHGKGSEPPNPTIAVMSNRPRLESLTMYLSDDSSELLLFSPNCKDEENDTTAEIALKESIDDDSEDESLSEFLRALDFYPPSDEEDDLYKQLDETLTTDGASTVSCSSLTHRL